jgi:Na+/H+-dicarboxylate symporter
MGRYRRGQILLNVAFCLFIYLVANFRPPLLGSFLKLVGSLALTCLLAFVVVHSANICRLVISQLLVLSESLFPLARSALVRRTTDYDCSS